jgi:GntR family transcriptional repressor for pyruvate dehydrogenase complex
MSQFKPIQKKTISSEIVEQVLSLIRTNQLKPGDRLPSERGLSQELNVGRSSVREAMKILEATGLIRTTNKGKVIREPADKELPTLLLTADRTNIHEVFETRKLMEIQLSGLAAERARPEDIEKMSQSLVQSDDPQRPVAGDIGFHRALVDAAHNMVFSEVYHSITGLLFQHFKYYSLILGRQKNAEEYLKEVDAGHMKILEAIKTRDPEAAQEAMKVHLERAEEMLIASLGSEIQGSDANHLQNAGGKEAG